MLGQGERVESCLPMGYRITDTVRCLGLLSGIGLIGYEPGGDLFLLVANDVCDDYRYISVGDTFA